MMTRVLLFSLSLLVVACSKTNNDDGDDNTAPEPTSVIEQQLVAARWQLVAETATATYNGKDTTADLYADLDSCEKDDYIEFSSTGTVTRYEHINRCSGNPASSTFTWKLIDSDKKIAIYDSNPDTFDLEISSNQMKFTDVKLNSSGVPVTYISTYQNIK